MTVTVYDVKDGDYVLVKDSGVRTFICTKDSVLLSENSSKLIFGERLRVLAKVSVPKEFT